MTRRDEDSTPPVVAAPHLCGGPGCYFCEWSNPTLEFDPGRTDAANQQ